ncbi:hypothetical protein L1281_001212 [Neisseria sp. HSC-16F19]|nr:NemA protein [Neisseria sp. HSC-16F19]MCP2040629.1 hypothetical protein [Neisseria sp. HSC-16F19]
MKTLSLSLLTAVCLSACGGSGLSIGVGGGGGNFGVGTSLHFPIGQGKQADGTNVQNHKIITYFDTQQRAQNKPVAGGYYRELLAERRGGLYLVQDFYTDGARKRSDPMLISQAQLRDFHAHPDNGSLSIYHASGRLARQVQYQDGKAIRDQSWPDR